MLLRTMIVLYLYFLTLFLTFLLFTLSLCRTYTPRTYNPSGRGLDSCKEGQLQWSRAYGGPPPETTKDRTQQGHIFSPQIRIKIPDPLKIEPGRRVGRQGVYRPRHGIVFLRKNKIFTSVIKFLSTSAVYLFSYHIIAQKHLTT